VQHVPSAREDFIVRLSAMSLMMVRAAIPSVLKIRYGRTTGWRHFEHVREESFSVTMDSKGRSEEMRNPTSRDSSIREFSSWVSCLAIKLAKARAIFSACVRAFFWEKPKSRRREIVVTRTVPFGTDSNESLLWTTDSGSSGKKALGSFTSVRNSEEKRVGGNSAWDPEECLLFYNQIHLVRCEVIPDECGRKEVYWLEES